MESVRTNLEEWKIRKQQERQDVAGAQKQALEEVISSGQALGSYLIGRGRLGSRLTSGNAALVLQANPLARAVMNYKQWQEFGRNVNKGAAGIPILTRQNGYFAVEKVFDVSQTYGNRPYPALELPASPEQMRQAVKALTSLCPVPVQAQLDLPQPALFDPEQGSVLYQADARDEDVLRFLPGVVLQAFTEQHTPGVSAALLMQIYGVAVSLEVCGRFGIPPMEGYAEKLEAFKEHGRGQTAREMLEELRELACAVGDNISNSLSLQNSLARPYDHEPR